MEDFPSACCMNCRSLAYLLLEKITCIFSITLTFFVFWICWDWDWDCWEVICSTSNHREHRDKVEVQHLDVDPASSSAPQVNAGPATRQCYAGYTGRTVRTCAWKELAWEYPVFLHCTKIPPSSMHRYRYQTHKSFKQLSGSYYSQYSAISSDFKLIFWVTCAVPLTLYAIQQFHCRLSHFHSSHHCTCDRRDACKWPTDSMATNPLTFLFSFWTIRLRELWNFPLTA